MIAWLFSLSAVALSAAVLPAAALPTRAAAHGSAATELNERTAALAAQDDPKAEYDRRRKAAGDNVEALWELYLWCDAYSLEKEGRSCLRAILKEDPAHAQAHEALGHILHDGQWFTNEKELEKYKAEQAERVAKEQGLVRYKNEWVPAEDVPFLERGLVRDDEGNWISAEDLERIRSGWRRQDLAWISPEEVPKLEQGLWKCGEEWKSLEEANLLHATLERWWIVPTNHFLVYSTCDRAIIEQAIEALERTYRELVRVFGPAPAGRLPVVLLRDPRQYGTFAAGPDGSGDGAETRGLSSVHHAYFADAWRAPELAESFGAGVALWDASSDDTSAFGPFAVRHAAALAFLEAIDPSPKTLAKLAKKTELEAADAEAFWAEKRIPEWLRYGAAAYAERYYVDSFVAQGGNPNWVREWSVSNLVRRGGLRPLKSIFSSELSVDDKPDSEKLINERGLIVAFIVDGACAPVSQAYAEFLRAFQEGKAVAKPLEDLVQQIIQHEAELRAFAGI